MSLKSGFIALLFVLFLNSGLQAKTFKYRRIGNKADIQTAAKAGIAMMGGGADLDDAFRWLCTRANGGDFLILRARGSNDYNPYVNGLCKLNSVATLVIPDRDAALDPKVADIIRHAEAIFIAGGNQARYIGFWRTSPVQDEINEHIAEGKPLGGTSAGLAVEGEYVYSAMNDRSDGPDLTSAVALANPYQSQVAVVRDFLRIPHLQNLITDSHFAQRDRLGRSLVFLARIAQDGWSKDPREVAIDERSAVLLEADGQAKVVGTGKGAYFLQLGMPPEVCSFNKPLTLRHVSAYHAPTGASFDLTAWTGQGGDEYSLSVEGGVVRSSRPDQSLY